MGDEAMGNFSEISKLKELRDARADAAGSGDAGTEGVSLLYRGGFGLIC